MFYESHIFCKPYIFYKSYILYQPIPFFICNYIMSDSNQVRTPPLLQMRFHIMPSVTSNKNRDLSDLKNHRMERDDKSQKNEDQAMVSGAYLDQ